MPYPLPWFVTSTTPALPLPLPPRTQEEYQVQLTESNRASATWKRKYDEAMRKMETMSGEIEQHKHESRTIVAQNILLQEKYAILDQVPRRRKKRMDFFASAHSDSDEPPTSRG
jgi:predicted transcriptional regulator